jgi:hypothetical protein
MMSGNILRDRGHSPVIAKRSESPQAADVKRQEVKTWEYVICFSPLCSSGSKPIKTNKLDLTG